MKFGCPELGGWRMNIGDIVKRWIRDHSLLQVRKQRELERRGEEIDLVSKESSVSGRLNLRWLQKSTVLIHIVGRMKLYVLRPKEVNLYYKQKSLRFWRKQSRTLRPEPINNFYFWGIGKYDKYFQYGVLESNDKRLHSMIPQEVSFEFCDAEFRNFIN